MQETRTYEGGAEALAALRPRLDDLPPEDIEHFRGNVPYVVGYLLQLARSYAEDRELFVRTFTRAGFDAARYDDMELRALALWQADVDYRQVVDPERSLTDLLARAMPLRKKLLRAAAYLWEEDVELGPQVVAIRAGQGHRDAADDLIASATLFESQWPNAAPRCDVTVEDLNEARHLGLEIMHRLNPETGRDATARARGLRDRAGTYALMGARDIRLAAAFVFRAQPDRLASYPNPLARSYYRRSTGAADAPPAEPDGGPAGSDSGKA